MIEADRQLKNEQDLELKEAMLMDKFKAEEADRQEEERKMQEVIEFSKKEAAEAEHESVVQKRKERFASVPEEPPQGHKPATKVKVSLPDGSQLMRRFDGTNTVQVLYDWVGGYETLVDREECSEFELVMTFPRKVLDNMEQTMKEA